MIRAVLCAIVAVCLLASPTAAQYRVLHGTPAAGGGVATGSHFVYGTAGQPVIGLSIGAGSFVKAGLWYCAAITSTVDVAITAFFAELNGDAVLLSWSVGASAGFDGFNVYRSSGTEGAFERLNEALVPASGAACYRDETVEPGTSYRYRIGATDGGREWYSPEVSVTLPPKPLTLRQNYPNPFNPSTNISFYLPSRGPVRLEIFDVRGARVATLVDDIENAGTHTAHWDGTNDAGATVASGVYYYRIEAGKDAVTKKLVIIR